MNKNTFIKNSLAGIVLFVLCLPLLQSFSGLVKERELGGAVESAECPDWTSASWLEGKFQADFDQYTNVNFGFRNSLVRLNNQIAYSLFKETRAKGVVVGKEGYLYEEEYLLSYTGSNFVGSFKVREKVDKLQKIQDTLQKKGIDLLVLVAPGKGFYYPEFIPEKYKTKARKTTNYKAYIQAFQEKNIRHLDFNKWFIDQKKSSPYPLYPKCGIHWSKYGEFLVADSLVKYVEQLRGIKMPRFALDSVKISDKNLYRDYDIGNGMNLIFDIPSFPMAYPKYRIVTDSTACRPRLMTVGDSYYWGMRELKLDSEVFSNGDFWYYNNEIYRKGVPRTKTASVSIESEIADKDVLLILLTEGRLSTFAFGFIDKTYERYFGNYESPIVIDEAQVKHYILKIKNTEKWHENLRKKSLEQGIPLEEVIRLNAIYMVKNEQASSQ